MSDISLLSCALTTSESGHQHRPGAWLEGSDGLWGGVKLEVTVPGVQMLWDEGEYLYLPSL